MAELNRKPSKQYLLMKTMNSNGSAKQSDSNNPSSTFLDVDHIRDLNLTAKSVDVKKFIQSFEDVPKVLAVTEEQVTEALKSIKNILCDNTGTWKRRQVALKKLRSLIMAGASKFNDFHMLLKPLELPLQKALKDLHSTVVQEACTSIGYLAINLGCKFDKSANFLLPTLLSLQQSPVKMVSSAGRIAVLFIIQTSSNPHIITVLSSHAVSSRSREIRSNCFELLEYIMKHRPFLYSQRHMDLLEKVLIKGVAEANPTALRFSRKAFEQLKEHFPARAEKLIQSFDVCYRKRLLQNPCMSTSSSHNTMKDTQSIMRTATDASRRGGLITHPVRDLQAIRRAKPRTDHTAESRSMSKITSSTAIIPRKSSEVSVPRPQERPSLPRKNRSQLPKKSKEHAASIFDPLIHKLDSIAPDL